MYFSVLYAAHEGFHGGNVLQLVADEFCYVFAHNQFAYIVSERIEALPYSTWHYNVNILFLRNNRRTIESVKTEQKQNDALISNTTVCTFILMSFAAAFTDQQLLAKYCQWKLDTQCISTAHKEQWPATANLKMQNLRKGISAKYKLPQN